MEVSKNVCSSEKVKKVYLEPANLCNLKCPLCPTSKRAYKHLGMMPLESFKLIVGKLGRHKIERFCLWGRGEPTMNLQLEDMVDFLSDKGIYSSVSTNGMLLNKERIQKLFEAGIGELIFSIDGITQKNYSKYRKGGNLKKVLSNLEFAVDRKKAMGAQTRIVWQFLAMRHNIAELSVSEKAAAVLGVDSFTLKKIGHVDDSEVKKRMEDFLPEDRSYVRSFYFKKNKSEKMDCDWLSGGLTIFWDGVVVSCNYDVYEKNIFGNIFENSLKEIIQKKSLAVCSLRSECASQKVFENIVNLF